MSDFPDRVLALEGVENFRDYGGYAGADSRRLARGRLYRSAHHARATDADLERMAGLKVAVIVDLRRGSERARDPSCRHAAFAGTVIDNDLGDEGTAPHLAFLAAGEMTEAAAFAFMVSEYERLPFEERHLDLFRRYFEALAQAGPGAVLIHCAAGKDRTGLLAALTHHVAGVHPDEAMADYLLTNAASRIDARASKTADALAETFGRRFDEAAVRRFMGVEAEYLHTARRVIDEKYGSMDAYLEQALGLDADRRARVEAHLLD